MHQGIWKKTVSGAMELRGKTLGIIGYGNIGSQLSVLAESLGMNVIFFDTSEKLSLGNAVRMDSMADALRVADVISVHVSGSHQLIQRGAV
jgi:D-3-phosphoglycerate dehydrogenase